MRDWNDVAGTLATGGSRARTPSRATGRRCIGRTRRHFPRTRRSTSRSPSRRPARSRRIVESIVPDGRAFTLRQHLSFLKLPDDGLPPAGARSARRILRHHVQGLRAADPAAARAALVARHRLERVDPTDPNSPIKNPIRLLRRPRNSGADAHGDAYRA